MGSFLDESLLITFSSFRFDFPLISRLFTWYSFMPHGKYYFGYNTFPYYFFHRPVSYKALIHMYVHQTHGHLQHVKDHEGKGIQIGLGRMKKELFL